MPILKPSLCEGCPFQYLSNYITPDYIIPNSTVTILAQNPGLNEEQGLLLKAKKYQDEITENVRPQPLIGASGKWLREEFFPLTRLDYSKVSRANVIKCRPHGVNELPSIGGNKPVSGITVKMLKEAVAHCTRAYLKLPETTAHIMAMGALSLYALTGESSISNWRGAVIGKEKGYLHSINDPTLFSGIKDYYHPTPTKLNIFPVIHIASLFKSQNLYHATLLDFRRFGKLVRGEWPKELPDIKVNYIPKSIPITIGFDTEYLEVEGSRKSILEMWSMADVESNIYVVDAKFSSRLSYLPPKLNLITQNGLVDLPHFIPLIPEGYDLSNINMEDCMLAHAVNWTGEANSLEYILSKVGRYNKHKHLRTTDDSTTKYIYAGLDADTTLNDAWYSCVQDFKIDPLAFKEYKLRRQPLLYIINRFNQRGLKVYKERVEYIASTLDEQMASIEARAKALTGNPNFSISSWQQVSQALYDRNMFTDPETAKLRKRSEKAKNVTPRAKKAKIVKESKEAKVKRLVTKNQIETEVADYITQLKLELGI